jgi:hypothetical protein
VFTFSDTVLYRLGSHHSLEVLEPIRPVHDRHDVVPVQQVSAFCEGAQLFVDTGQETLKNLRVASWKGKMLLD